MSERINITLTREQWALIVRGLDNLGGETINRLNPEGDIPEYDLNKLLDTIQDILEIEPLPEEKVAELYSYVENDDCQPDGAPYASCNADGSIGGWWVPCAVYVANNEGT
jgi:hypothetical protein